MIHQRYFTTACVTSFRVIEVSRSNSMLEVKLGEACRLIKFYSSREKTLTEERDMLLTTVTSLQQSLQEQNNLRVENQRLKEEVMDLKRSNDRRAEAEQAEVQRLLREIGREQRKHQGELEAVRRQCRTEVELVESKVSSLMEVKDSEVTKILEEKDKEVEEMRKKLKDHEREKQSELLRLQMEFGAKLARVQSSAQRLQQQQQQHHHGSSLLPPSVFKRKLQFFQEEKNKEIMCLRERIKDLEENQRVSEGGLKRKRN
ncbi:coiled-coil domain-containing protein 152 isoform X2 [Cynoglossus semilaevis]|uniref:coiled-coil domain-containing protein 152 isoform X2 n=1 Tax=Cynoglossus semilaevis TaxID=244447 RepID=UPI000D62E945|nr:coiled-coil domain-containing protein 152 isoform X2 [Cynoglossus semilaevis]